MRIIAEIVAWIMCRLFWGFFQFVYWANGLCSMTSSQMWLSGVIGTLSLSADFLDDWTLPSKESPCENPLQMLIPIDRYWPIPMTNTCVENQQNRIQTNYGQYMWRLVKMSCPTLVQKSDLGAGPLLKVFFLLSSFRNKRNYKKSSIFQLKPYFLHNVASAVHFQLVSEEMDHSCWEPKTAIPCLCKKTFIGLKGYVGIWWTWDTFASAHLARC